MLLQSKIHPDNLKPVSKIVARTSLVEVVRNNMDKSVFLLEAPAGYGKNTLISEIITSTGIPYAYYRIDESDENLYRIFSYLIGAIEKAIPGFGKEALDYLESFRDGFSSNKIPGEKIEGLISLITNEIYNIEESFFIVLNDFHLLPDDPIIRDAVSLFQQNIPPRVKLLIASREGIKIGLANLISKRQVFIINPKLLSFNKNEIIDLAFTVYGKNIQPKEAEQIQSLTEGWVTGIHLCLQSETFPHLDGNIPGTTYDFFAEEIFNHLEEDTKEFLMLTSVPDTFDIGILEFLFQDLKVENILQLLLHKNIFVNKLGGLPGKKNTVRYYYNNLFRKFLTGKFDETVKEAEKKKFYERLALYMEKEDNAPGAVKFFLQAENYDKAVSLIKKNIKTALHQDLTLAAQWISSIPQDTKDKELYFFEAILCKNFHTDFSKAIELFNKVLEAEPRDAVLDIKSRSYIAESYIKLGESKKAEKIIKNAIKDFNHPFTALLYFKLAQIQESMTLYDDAQKTLNKGLEIIESSGKDDELQSIKYQIMNSLGNVSFIKGDYTKSSYYYNLAVGNMKSRYQKFQVYYNISYVNAHSGNFPETFEILNLFDTYHNLKELPELKILLLHSRVIFYYELCDYESCLSYCGLLLKHSNSIEHGDSKFDSLKYSSLSYIYLNDLNKAKKYLELARDVMEVSNEEQNIEIKMLQGLVNKADGKLPKAEKELLPVNDFFTRKELINDKTFIEFHLADLYIKKGNGDKAKDYLSSSIENASKYKYENIYRRELLYDRSLFDFALKNKIHRNFIDDIYALVFTKDEHTYLSDKAGERIREDIENLYSVKLHLLGADDIFVNNIVIQDKKWTRKNFKSIFIYFMLNRKNHLSKDFIVDKFLDDVPYEHIDNIFHQLLSCIRTVLKTGKENSSLKDDIFIYKKKILSLNEDYHYFIDSEEFLTLHKKITSLDEPGTDILRRAVELYKGNLMTDVYEQWAEDIRTELDDKYYRLLCIALDISLKEKSYEDVIYFSEKMIKNDSLDETAYVENIRANIMTKNIKAAKARFEHMKTTFLKETEEMPSQKALAEIQDILS